MSIEGQILPSGHIIGPSISMNLETGETLKDKEYYKLIKSKNPALIQFRKCLKDVTEQFRSGTIVDRLRRPEEFLHNIDLNKV